MDENLMTRLQGLCEKANEAKFACKIISDEQRKAVLVNIAATLLSHKDKILAANAKDIALANERGKNKAFIDRLMLDEKRITAMADSVSEIAQHSSPLSRVLHETSRPNGLVIKKVSVPIGVIAMIYESRPNVTADASALCLKSGNAVILRPGQESFNSANAIVKVIQEVLTEASLNPNMVMLVPLAQREVIDYLVSQPQYIDVVIPRGGQALIEHLHEVSKVPLFMHLSGLCHTYVHHQAKLELAIEVVVNAKCRRSGICGATETLLIDEAILETHLIPIINALEEKGCLVKGDERVAQYRPNITKATELDWDTEYLDDIISIKVVKNIDEAIGHINTHGSEHTESILTEDQTAVEQFMRDVDSAIVMHNTSTQFADGGEFGLGAEIGIATGRLHARGPVGAEQLTTFCYQVYGNGQVRP